MAATGAAKRLAQARNAMRAKIRAAPLIYQIKQVAVRAENADKLELDRLRLKLDSYRILLAKVVPDLKAVEHSGKVEHAVIGEKPLSAEEWEAQHCMGAPAGAAGSVN